MNNNNGRYCGYFHMTNKEFQAYMDSKHTKIFWYLGGMFIVSFLSCNVACWILLTIWLIASYYDNYKREEQWVKDGALTWNDLK